MQRTITSLLEKRNALWERHHTSWRDPVQIISQWQEASEIDSRLLKYRTEGAWWEILAECGVTLLVTREYEHLVMAMYVADTGPVISYWQVPHPSGLAVDRERGVVYIASTRNPNQVYDLKPVIGMIPRRDMKIESLNDRPLIPLRSRFNPGCLYLHDLAFIGGKLYANAVGQNAVVQLHDDGSYQRVWWPRCIETENGPVFERNHIQMNSIASGIDLKTSFFSASSDKLSARCPGHKNFPVDKRGVIFSGATREPAFRGLTRPHSARLYNGQIWIDNSGYGEFGIAEKGRFVPVVKLPGWTRGLCLYKQIAFVGTSRVLPRFRQYAPGLDVNTSLCGVHIVERKSGKVLGSLIWPYGNQIFAVDWLSSTVTSGFPCLVGTKRAVARYKTLYYAFSMEDNE